MRTGLVLLVSLGLSILLQELALRLRTQERATWWASNGRDVANLVATVLLVLAMYLRGAPWPLAILLGATLTLILSSLGRALYGRIAHPWAVVALVGVLLVVPLLVAPLEVFRLTQRVVDALF